MERVTAHDFESFRVAARSLIARHRQPHEVSFGAEGASQASLFDLTVSAPPAQPASSNFRVPARYVELAQLAALYRSDDRFDLLYRVLYRLTHGEHELLADVLDPSVRELTRRVQSVRHDEHRMHAFVRFHRVVEDGDERFLAWYEPEHLIVPLAAPFFARRFAVQRWAIMTADESAFWDGSALHFGPGVERSAVPTSEPSDGDVESLFRTYYGATFNPARNNPALFARHVPRAFQRNMPELTNLPQLLASARTPGAAVSEPSYSQATTLAQLAHELRSCRACPLGEHATHAVAGEGPLTAQLCLVGEQPGDEEDRLGRPFVGPAGRLLDRALVEAGLQRDQLYVTNAVKHFGFRVSGKKRLHQTPRWENVGACKPWLSHELALLKPQLVVCMGATAAQSFFGRRFSVTPNRGRVFQTADVKQVLVTFHPSAVLRAVDEPRADALYAAMVEDLKRARMLLDEAARV